MRVMIDFTQIPTMRTGVGVYGENLLREMAQFLRPDDLLLVLVQSDERLVRELTFGIEGVRLLKVPSSVLRNRAALLLFEQIVMPFLLLFHKVDVLHSLHYTHPLLCPCKWVVTIHDLTFLLFPELHTRGRRLIMPFFIRHAMRRADAVIFVSESTRSDALRLIPYGNAIGATVPLGVDSVYQLPATAADVKSTLQRLELTQPFILNMGTIEPRKNLIRLVRAFEAIADHDPIVTLVLAGKLGWDYTDALREIDSSRHSQRIKRIGFVSEDDKRSLLNACAVFIYPSLYEGFGLPVLEAMAAGAPIITSSNSSLSEVAGDAAELVNPVSVPDLTKALSELLSDEAKRYRLQTNGRRRSALFTWTRTASETYSVYSRVLAKDSGCTGE